MLYDIPGRTGAPIETETLVRLAEHGRIVAVKDAKGDLEASAWVMKRSDLAYYSGEDTLNLPLLSIGAVGFVGVAGHLVRRGDRADDRGARRRRRREAALGCTAAAPASSPASSAPRA